jgi:hypothetical protein
LRATRRGSGLLRRGACYRAALCADPLAPRNVRETCVLVPAAYFARVVHLIHPRRKPRAQGRPGGRKHPGPPRKRNLRERAMTTGTGGNNRPSLRSGLRLIRALPGEPAFATVVGAMRKHRRQLKRLHGRARTTRLRRPRRCRSSHGINPSTAFRSTFVTIAKRPSCRSGTAPVNHDF